MNPPSSDGREPPAAPPRAPTPPLLVYDGDCDLCKTWALRYGERLGDRIELVAGAALGPRHPELSAELLARSIVYVDASGTLYEGADALCGLLELGGRHWPARLYRRLPGFAPLAEALYRLLARHRRRLGGTTCSLPETPPPPPPEAKS